MMLRFIQGFSWYLLHILVSIMHIGSDLIQAIACYIISSGFLEKYRMLQLHKLQHLAIVVDSEEARNITQIKQLLRWLSDIGLKYIMLYDIEGVLKKSLETTQIGITNSNSSSNSNSCSTQDAALMHVISRIHNGKMTIELLSSSDGKEGAAKAANFLFFNYSKKDVGNCNKKVPTFTETDMAAALKAVGCDGPDPDLLLVYGPARCHLGFPAWRMRYTEIVHMGRLKSMKYGAILKAFYEFSSKHQNYGNWYLQRLTSFLLMCDSSVSSLSLLSRLRLTSWLGSSFLAKSKHDGPSHVNQKLSEKVGRSNDGVNILLNYQLYREHAYFFSGKKPSRIESSLTIYIFFCLPYLTEHF